MADKNSILYYDTKLVDSPEGTIGEGDLSFAAFSLSHAACGDDVLEVRIAERMLLAWCMGCAVKEVFAPCEG